MTADESRTIVVDVGSLVDPDVIDVEALARLQLSVRQMGGTVTLRGVTDSLRDLLAYLGLDDVLLAGSDEISA